MIHQKQIKLGGLGAILSLVIYILLIIGFYFFMKYAFIALLFLLPVSFIAIFIIDKSTLIHHFKSYPLKVKRDIIGATISVILHLFLLPFISVYLLLKALSVKKFNTFKERSFEEQKIEFTEYEEIKL